jgi:hypothetical protein
MEHAKKPSDTKIIEFLATEDSVEMQLVYWIRDLVNCTNELVPTLERLRSSYRLLRADKPVTDAEEILWRVEQCLKDAEISSLLGLAWLRGPRAYNHLRAVQMARQPSIFQEVADAAFDSCPHSGIVWRQ